MEKVSSNELIWGINWEVENANFTECTPQKQTSDNLKLATLDSVEPNEDEPEEKGMNEAEQENNDLTLQLDWWKKSREPPEQVIPTINKMMPSIIKPPELELKPLPKNMK